MKPTIAPIGIGDLMVLKKKLIRYEAGEVAHIENVMATEARKREHRRLRRIEEVVVTEQERTEESKRDLQTTERFELESEIQKTVQSDTKFEAGAEISAGFGPVQIGAYSRFSTGLTKTESQRNATNYAKEVTERSLKRLVERVRTERTLRTLEEFEEKNEHGFDNTGGENRTGIYRFVDAYYRAKIVNYGKRLFYEFTVPEPAAFYIFARTFDFENRTMPAEPEEPVDDASGDPLNAGHISRDNYLALSREYDAEGVSPPPAETIVLAKTISRSFSDTGQHWAFADSDFEIPQGYQLRGTAATLTTWAQEDFFLAVLRSRRRWMLNSATGGELETNENETGGIRGVLPLAAQGFGINSFTFAVRATCELTPEAFEEWQLKTFNAIMAAYRKKLVDYQEQVAAAQVQAGTGVGGNHPAINRAIEREELRKACITLWTGFQYNGVPGISHDPDLNPPANYPRIRIANALEMAPEIQFLEQAFDWRNMTYEFHPYYWKRRTQWVDAYALKDDDLLFSAFLKAGAARVVVPVHLSATQAVLFYQLTGKLWPGEKCRCLRRWRVPRLRPTSRTTRRRNLPSTRPSWRN